MDKSIEEILKEADARGIGAGFFDGKSDEELQEITWEDLHDYQLKFLKG